ncbi:MAG: F0F1 ATP synthase subunit B [Phycisphaerae bacterium]|nr:F0F1 ATP synthase subunit B [Phycisphaerae bacterium]
MLLNKSYIKTLIIVMLLAMPAMASDGGEKSAGIFAGDIFTAIFTLVLFLVLVMVLGKFAWKPILNSLKERENHIRSTIENAEQAQVKAEKKLAAYEKRLAQAQQEADEMMEKSRAEAAGVVNQMKQQCQLENQKVRQEARMDIERARREAVKEMHVLVTQIATDLAGRIIAKNINAADHQELIEESLCALGVSGQD